MAASKLIYLCIETGFFVSHRLPLAELAKRRGFEVVLVSDGRKRRNAVEEAGIRLVECRIERKGVNPFAALPALWRLWRIYQNERPDVVHHIALKPILLGGLVARLAGVPRVVGSVTGLGFLYIDEQRLPWVRRLVEFLLPRLMDIAIVQNADDAAILARIGMPVERIRLIPGAGVDIDAFPERSEPEGEPVVMLPSRLLWDKGVAEFEGAARKLRGRARFVLVGDTDPGNRAGVPRETLATWQDEGVVEWWGFREDMPNALAEAHIICLPSYREGFPKVLLEAAACGRAIVTTDAPGCRDAVADGETGLIVPVRDPDALASAIERLLSEPESRRRMGVAGRARVEREFSIDVINPKVLETYRD